MHMLWLIKGRPITIPELLKSTRQDYLYTQQYGKTHNINMPSPPHFKSLAAWHLQIAGPASEGCSNTNTSNNLDNELPTQPPHGFPDIQNEGSTDGTNPSPPFTVASSTTASVHLDIASLPSVIHHEVSPWDEAFHSNEKGEPVHDASTVDKPSPPDEDDDESTMDHGFEHVICMHPNDIKEVKSCLAFHQVSSLSQLFEFFFHNPDEVKVMKYKVGSEWHYIDKIAGLRLSLFCKYAFYLRV
jgi:hypothetical protein